MGIPFWQVDAFTDRPFAGNPAAVCVLPGSAAEGWMQGIAREMNLSETAFLWPQGGSFRLRWFTPAVEVELCGHATLASAHVVWSEGLVPSDQPVRFFTASGTLTARRRDALIELDFPRRSVQAGGAVAGLTESLGCRPEWVGFAGQQVLALLDGEESLRSLAPDFGRLAGLPVRGVVATAPADDPEFDFVSRYFAPAIGIDEDPVTGSAHCALGPFWAERLDRSELRAKQISPRGGVVRVRVLRDRVLLGGEAVTIARGELLV